MGDKELAVSISQGGLGSHKNNMANLLDAVVVDVVDAVIVVFIVILVVVAFMLADVVPLIDGVAAVVV